MPLAVGVRLDDLVGGAREDVVGADQEDLLLALLLEVVQARDDLLVGGRAGVEDVRRLLQALVLHRVEEQRLVLSKTGSTALRLAEVQQPKTAATLSCVISFCAFSAKVGQSEAPSSTTGSSFLPSTPPAALISSIASSSASRTVTSLIAIVPLSECRMPDLDRAAARCRRGAALPSARRRTRSVRVRAPRLSSRLAAARAPPASAADSRTASAPKRRRCESLRTNSSRGYASEASRNLRKSRLFGNTSPVVTTSENERLMRRHD